MFRKYEKTFRIVIPQIDVVGKFALSKKEMQNLLGGQVVIEEKMDGANAGIIRHKTGFHLQKRNSLVAQSEHEQFSYFYNWAWKNYDKIMKIPVGYVVYGELLYIVHTIYYDKLPDFFLVFDIFDKNNNYWLDYEERNNFCQEIGFHQVPFIAKGFTVKEDLFDLIPEKSAYGDTCEGIVVKKYKKGEYFKGKIVKAEFIKTLDESEHWTKQHVKKNKLRDVQEEEKT